MRKKIAKIIIAASATCYLFSSVTAYASWTSSGRTDNYVSMGSYKTSIEEEYTQPLHVDPSQTVDKIVNVKNSGTVGTFVRVAIEKKIGDVNADGTFVSDETLDPEMIMITCNETVWKNGGDGYYYYLKELKPGETTEEPLFKSFTFSAKAGNAYRKKVGNIIVKMESIQAEGNAISLWGKTTTDLGIQYKKAEQTAEPTNVTFLGKKEGFDITSKKPDLFSNFKNLMPGTSRAQVIKLVNTSKQNVEFSLKAEAVGQENMSNEQLALVDNLLNEYATISIENDGKTVYDGAVSGKPDMQNNAISLGTMKAGSTKDMTVTLKLSPDMDNHYLDLLGKVRWVFTATGDDDKSKTDTSVGGNSSGSSVGSDGNSSVNTPKTGDMSMTPATVSFATASILLGTGLILLKKKEDENA